jgi:YidC/Oxa1 family membrane protein insertase
MSVVFGVPVDVAYYLVSWLARVLAPLLGGLAAVAAIVVFTMAVRLLVLPLSYYAFRGERARSRLMPKVQELQRRHRQHPERLQRELTALYKAEGTGMFAGCLPALLQVPFFSIVYRLFLSRTVRGGPNTLLSHDLLAAPLGSHWLSGAGPFSAQGMVFAVLFGLLALVGVFSVRAARRMTAGQSAVPRQPGGATGAMGALAKVIPFGTVLMAAVVPLAAGLYLLTTTAWTVTERAVLRRRLLPGPDPAPPAR